MSEQITDLKTHLSLIRTLKTEEAEEEFFKLMNKAKEALGEVHPQMAYFYYEYANFILNRVETNIETLDMNLLNAKDKPIGQELEQIEQNYEDSSDEDSGVKSQNNILVDSHQEQFENPPEDNPPEDKDQNEKEDKEPHLQRIVDEDDRQICFLNLSVAIKIYRAQLEKVNNGQDSPYNRSQILDRISRARARLGDLFKMTEEHAKAIDEYRGVVEDEEKREGHDCKRALAEMHYLIATQFLQQNKDGCEQAALSEFFKAVNIIVNHLGLIKHYNIEDFELPRMDKHKVDRFAYLPKPFDQPDILQLKQTLSDLLDEIEATHEQIAVRHKFEEMKKKEQVEKRSEGFKQVSAGTPVIRLGVFGNRKRPPNEVTEANNSTD